MSKYGGFSGLYLDTFQAVCVIFITWVTISFCTKFKKKNRKIGGKMVPHRYYYQANYQAIWPAIASWLVQGLKFSSKTEKSNIC